MPVLERVVLDFLPDPMMLGMIFLIFMVALLYASVGHGGASGYFAVLSFFAFSPDEMATTALLLNVIVAGLAFIAYYRAGYFIGALSWPFMAASVPAAYFGGRWTVPKDVYSVVLAGVLLFASVRLATHLPENENALPNNRIPLGMAFVAGGGIGLLSGMIGVGGGIFLSPLMLLMHWADVKHTAATSALFIVVNALAGLTGRHAREGLLVGDLLPFLVAASIGGLMGAFLGAQKISSRRLRQFLSVVLMIAAFKLVMQSGLF